MYWSINHKDVFIPNFSGEDLWEEGNVSIKLQKCHPTTWSLVLALGKPCWHQCDVGAGGRKGAIDQIFLWWPYSFFLSNSLGPSLLPLLYLPVCPLLFLPSSSRVPSFLKGMSRYSMQTISFPFIVIVFPLALDSVALNSFMFLSLPTWILGKTNFWKIWGLHYLHLWVCGNKP